MTEGKCSECGKQIGDGEWVVNWGSCNECFDSHYETYLKKAFQHKQDRTDGAAEASEAAGVTRSWERDGFETRVDAKEGL